MYKINVLKYLNSNNLLFKLNYNQPGFVLAIINLHQVINIKVMVGHTVY